MGGRGPSLADAAAGRRAVPAPLGAVLGAPRAADPCAAAVCGRAGRERDLAGEDAPDSGDAPPRRRRAGRPARPGRVDPGWWLVSDALIWSAVALALLVSVVRRRSVAILLVTLQTLVIAAGAFQVAHDHSPGFLTATFVLAAKGVLVGAVLLLAVGRTREPRAVRVGTPPLLRLSVTVAISLALVGLVPRFGLHDAAAEHAAVALVAIGIVTAVLHPTTLFQVIGLLAAENGLALAAAHAVGGLPTVIELGAAFDLVLVVAVATVFHHRIFEEFGSADTMLLRGLRD